jgi:hypothetical protein
MEIIKKIIYNLISHNIFKKQQLIPLGRWNVENCIKKINRKIDLSNEDHCGPCGKEKQHKY